VTTAVAISDEGRVAAALPMSDVSWEALQEWADEQRASGYRVATMPRTPALGTHVSNHVVTEVRR
jgi:hypothetical protein